MISKLLICCLSIFLTNCALYYRDIESGTDHLWGFGHLATKISEPNDKKQAVIRQVTLAGFGLDVEDESFEISAGWHQSERIHLYEENAAISIQRPENGDSFLFKFGSEPKSNQTLSNISEKRITP
jgi:hypothetical protein